MPLTRACWKTPSGVRIWLMTCPCPPHWLHVLAVVPGFVPLPSHVPHPCRLSTCGDTNVRRRLHTEALETAAVFSQCCILPRGGIAHGPAVGSHLSASTSIFHSDATCCVHSPHVGPSTQSEQSMDSCPNVLPGSSALREPHLDLGAGAEHGVQELDLEAVRAVLARHWPIARLLPAAHFASIQRSRQSRRAASSSIKLSGCSFTVCAKSPNMRYSAKRGRG